MTTPDHLMPYQDDIRDALISEEGMAPEAAAVWAEGIMRTIVKYARKGEANGHMPVPDVRGQDG